VAVWQEVEQRPSFDVFVHKAGDHPPRWTAPDPRHGGQRSWRRTVAGLAGPWRRFNGAQHTDRICFAARSPSLLWLRWGRSHSPLGDRILARRPRRPDPHPHL